MTHIAIMKKKWGLTDKIIDGSKTVEMRWYKHRSTPWDKVSVGDEIFFKDSGGPVRAKANLTLVEQYEIKDTSMAKLLIDKYKVRDLGSDVVPKEISDYINGKKYCIIVGFDNVISIKPFNINKTGFGAMCAWIVSDNIENLML